MWPRSSGARLWIVGLALLAADSALFAIGPRGPVPRSPFQEATGGIGLGSSVSPAWSFFGFDPRCESTCENELFPIPGLPCPNPGHGTGVADLPPLERAPD